MCGEKERRKRNVICLRGSPPRVRGKGSSSFDLLARHRITPACAGKSQRKVLEKATRLGSPPRVRGKDRLVQPNQPLWRITPACAGKSCDSHFFSPLLWDHPRVCGEKQRCHIVGGKRQGSPPRVRGKVNEALESTNKTRITPACAGKRWCANTRKPHPEDHPRVCGEKLWQLTSRSETEGSPPRVRGKEDRLSPRSRAWRITPACAGKSLPCWYYQKSCWDHPRVCGEKVFSNVR